MHDDDYTRLKSNLLIAMPAMDDPFFSQTVTLVCEHSHDGCFGITINRPMSLSMAEVLEKLNINHIPHDYDGIMSLSGGPVQPEQGYVLHDGDSKQWEKTLRINDQLSVSMSTDILKDIAKGKGPDNFLFALGCAMWSPGQLENEIKENTWLTCPSDNRILFNTPNDKRWLESSNLLGIDVRLMTDAVGHA